jgi:hypothetical protein
MHQTNQDVNSTLRGPPGAPSTYTTYPQFNDHDEAGLTSNGRSGQMFSNGYSTQTHSQQVMNERGADCAAGMYVCLYVCGYVCMYVRM